MDQMDDRLCVMKGCLIHHFWISAIQERSTCDAIQVFRGRKLMKAELKRALAQPEPEGPSGHEKAGVARDLTT
jgi:hypothetical protein